MITIPKFILKSVKYLYGVSNLKKFHLLTHDDMEFELKLEGPFWVEISSNGNENCIMSDLFIWWLK